MEFIIIINVVVFILEIFNPQLIEIGAVNAQTVFKEGQIYRLFTSIFLHVDMMHLFWNMFSLFFLSNILITIVGKKKYLIIYFISGIIGGFISISVKQIFGLDDTLSVGASGAIMGLLGANIMALVKYRNERVIKSVLIRLFIFAAINTIPIHSGIDYVAHACGLVTGIISTLILSKVRGNQIESGSS